MTHTLVLTPDEDQKLQRAAEKRGQETDTLVREAVLEMLLHSEEASDDDLPAPGESLYDAMKDYIGMFQSSSETTWSENTGEKFTEGLLEKKRQKVNIPPGIAHQQRLKKRPILGQMAADFAQQQVS